MLKIIIYQRVFVLPFISVMMLAGCAGTLDERRQMKNEGRAQNSLNIVVMSKEINNWIASGYN